MEKKELVRYSLIVIIVLVLWAVAIPAPVVSTVGPTNKKVLEKTTLRVAYVHWDNTAGVSDFNNAIASVGDIYGKLLSYRILSTGVDANYTVSVYIDPIEFGEDTSSTQKLILSQDCNTVEANEYSYPFTITDSASNLFGGYPIAGRLYVGISNANDVNATLSDPGTNLTDLKVYITYDESAPSK